MQITIDQHSGYCFGVEFAIQMAEEELQESGTLYCLGDIVHNGMEVKRLAALGLQVINRDELQSLKNCKVLIRAHGEPPETYQLALQNNIELIDASCPVVLKLQNRVKNAFDKIDKQDGQVIIYGKKGHAEVIGLTGQTKEKAIVVTEEEDLDQVDFSKPVVLFSQTTKSTKGFYKLKAQIEQRIQKEGTPELLESFRANDSICRQVSNREPQLIQFSSQNDIIIFVSGRKSSNGRSLYGVCKANNDRSYFIENAEDLNEDWFVVGDKVGIAGATSTPSWLMQDVANAIQQLAS